MNKEQIDNFIQEVLTENPPSDDVYYVGFGAMVLLRDKILEYIPEDYSQLSKEAQEVLKEFDWYNTEDELRQVARHQFTRITHDVTPDAEAGAIVMEDVFIDMLYESHKKENY